MPDEIFGRSIDCVIRLVAEIRAIKYTGWLLRYRPRNVLLGIELYVPPIA